MVRTADRLKYTILVAALPGNNDVDRFFAGWDGSSQEATWSPNPNQAWRGTMSKAEEMLPLLAGKGPVSHARPVVVRLKATVNYEVIRLHDPEQEKRQKDIFMRVRRAVANRVTSSLHDLVAPFATEIQAEFPERTVDVVLAEILQKLAQAVEGVEP